MATRGGHAGALRARRAAVSYASASGSSRSAAPSRLPARALASSSLARAARPIAPRVALLDLSEWALRRKVSRSRSTAARRSAPTSARPSSTKVSISSATNAPPIVTASRSTAARSIARDWRALGPAEGGVAPRGARVRAAGELTWRSRRVRRTEGNRRPTATARARVRSPPGALERGDQLLHPDRLRHVVVHPRRRAQLAVALHRVRGHGDEPRPTSARPAPGDLAGGLEAVEFRHLQVHQDHVVRLPLDGVNRLQAVGGHVGPVAHLAEEPERHLLVDRVILGQEDPERVPARHLRVECAPRQPARRHVDGLLGQDGDQRVEELRRLDGLVEVRGEALAIGARLATAERREENQGQCPPRRVDPDRPGQGHAVHLRHVHVQDADVEALLGPDPRERLTGRCRRPRLHPPGLQMQGEDAAVGRVVVHHEHALAAERRLHAAQVALGRERRLGRRPPGS